MSLGSASSLIRLALEDTLGEGYTSTCTLIPKGVELVDSYRHYDYTGVVYLMREDLVVPVTNGLSEANVHICVYRCLNCGSTRYRVTGIEYLVEYSPTPSGQDTIARGFISMEV